MSKQTISVFGLGSMGFGVACSALAAGHPVYGFDVNIASQDRFLAKGGDRAEIAEAGAVSDVVISVVLNGAQTTDILFGEAGIVPHMRPGSVVISCATVAPDLARGLAAKCDAFQVLYLDAPISGGSVKAAEGALTMMASGSADAFAAAQPALDAITQTVYRLGDVAGPGSAMKAVNQLLAGVHIAAMGEALTFGISQGVDAARKREGQWLGEYTNSKPVGAFMKYLFDMSLGVLPKVCIYTCMHMYNHEPRRAPQGVHIHMHVYVQS